MTCLQGIVEKVAKPLYIVPYGLSSFLDSRKEFVHGHLSIIFVKSGEEPGFQVEPCFDGVCRKTPEPIKATP